MKPFLHARGSVARWGGSPDDYLPIHDFIDETKIAMPDLRHRAVLHNAFGCFLVERVFGHTIKNSDGRDVSTRDVAEQHIIEDMGFLPSLEDWLDELPQSTWHGGIHRLPKGARALATPTTRKGHALMALKTAIANLNAARRKYDDELAQLGEDTGKAVAEFLGEHIPPGFHVEWRQYTPYFNDGEPCVFSVHEPYLCKAGDEVDDEDEHPDDRDDSVWLGGNISNYDNPESKYPIEPIAGLSREALEALAAAWSELPEAMLERAFGDHAKIVVRKAADGSVTWDRSEHSHD